MNRIHHTAVIGDDVELGDGNVVGPYSVIVGACEIGDHNWFGPHVVIGTPAEMRGSHHPSGWDGEPGTGTISIGNRNVVREFTAISAGSDGGTTTLGDDCYVMDKVHISHDCDIGDAVTISCAVIMAGHIVLGDGCNLGLGAILHQGMVIGEGSMIGMGSVITRHVAPFALAYGSPARVHGANRTGLERRGVDPERIDAIDAAHRAGEGLSTLMVEEYRRFENQVGRITEHG